MDNLMIYFDMDGVLANFDEGVRTLCKLEPIAQDAPERNDDVLWARVREIPHFYDMLEPMPGACEMFREVFETYGKRCEILTGIPKPHRGIESAAEDKRKWVNRVLSPDIVVHTVLREEKKQYCKGKESILVDDFVNNIKEWRECGGTGILHVDSVSTLNSLRKIESMLQ